MKSLTGFAGSRKGWEQLGGMCAVRASLSTELFSRNVSAILHPTQLSCILIAKPCPLFSGNSRTWFGEVLAWGQALQWGAALGSFSHHFQALSPVSVAPTRCPSHTHTCGDLQQGQPARGTHPGVTPSHPSELFPANLLPEALLQDNLFILQVQEPSPERSGVGELSALRNRAALSQLGLSAGADLTHTHLPAAWRQRAKIHPNSPIQIARAQCSLSGKC